MKHLSIILILTLAISFQSCRIIEGVTRSETVETTIKEKVIVPNMTTKEVELVVQDGIIVDILEKLEWNDSAIVAEIKIIDNQLGFNLIQQDTITIEKEVVKEVYIEEEKVVVKIRSPKIAYYSYALNIFILLLVALRIYIKSVSSGLL